MNAKLSLDFRRLLPSPRHYLLHRAHQGARAKEIGREAGKLSDCVYVYSDEVLCRLKIVLPKRHHDQQPCLGILDCVDEDWHMLKRM